MRIKLGFSVVVLVLACDDRVVVPEVQAPANQQARGDDEVHPYLTCVEGDLDPVCEAGCGDEGPADDPHVVCAIPCSDVSECEAYGGASTVACIEGRCYFLCEGDADCPEGLECINRGTTPYDVHPELDECKAPGGLG